MAMRAAEVFGGDHLIAIGGEVPPELLESNHEDGAFFTTARRQGPDVMKVALMGGRKDMALKDGVFDRAKAWYTSKGHLVEEVRWNGGHSWNEGMDQAVQAQLLDR
jgi:predicted esterase